MTNALYYGDNLTVLREHVPDESVDLVYLDPPFNSNASYNVLYHSDLWQTDFPKIQIRTIEELLQDNGFQMPRHQPMYQPARRIVRPEGEQGRLA